MKPIKQKPFPPHKPIAPRKQYESYECIPAGKNLYKGINVKFNKLDLISIKDFVALFKEYEDRDDLFFEKSFCYECGNELDFTIKQKVVNENQWYEKELLAYNKKLAIYTESLKEYEIALQEWEGSEAKRIKAESDSKIRQLKKEINDREQELFKLKRSK